MPIAGTYDGAFVRFYVDGVEVTPAVPTNLTINYALPTNSNFYIGSYVAPGWCTLPFNGSIDEVRVFNSTLREFSSVEGVLPWVASLKAVHDQNKAIYPTD